MMGIKPLFIDEANEFGLCPTCSDIIKPKVCVCKNCGQKIDWSEYEKEIDDEEDDLK